ncbi:HlyD family type I secretion periplasmic adaptor subunit [Micromonospora sp. STR1s_5]|nr:HlyD family type I secretion periplasmic adaptor subunit [Micromonospora sp. STR1s_5]
MMDSTKELLMAPKPSDDYRSTLRVGYVSVFVTFGVFGGWAATAPLASAVVAPGAISTESNRKTVQHLEGGIVRELLVRDGSLVREGDVLLRLDPTRSEAQSDLYRKQLAAALAAEARYVAQRDFKAAVTFPPEVMQLAGDVLVSSAILDNRRQFEGRREGLVRALDVIDTQIQQVEKEIQQTAVDLNTAREQLATVDKELPAVRDLYSKGLVALPRLTTLERTSSEVQGKIGGSTIALAKGQDKIAELKARADQLRQDYRQEGANALPDLGKVIGDLRQQMIVAGDALKRIEIVAPVSGAVQQLRIFTIGGVVKAGEPILDIVPDTDTLVVRAKVSPIDVDRVRQNAYAEIRLPQFTRYRSEVIRGAVATISRDALLDEVTRAPYFAVEVSVERSTVPNDIAEKLTAGMTVEIVLPTGERTALQYLIAPIWNRMSTAMRER